MPRDTMVTTQGEQTYVVLPIQKDFEQYGFVGCSIKDKQDTIHAKQFSFELMTFLDDFVEKRGKYL